MLLLTQDSSQVQLKVNKRAVGENRGCRTFCVLIDGLDLAVGIQRGRETERDEVGFFL